MKNKQERILFVGLSGLLCAYIVHRCVLLYEQGTGTFLEKLQYLLKHTHRVLNPLFHFSFSFASLIGFCCVLLFTGLFALYIAFDDRVYRHGEEFGSAKWGTRKDIKPFIDKQFDNNIIFTETEQLSMAPRHKIFKYTRNKNVCVIGGAGSGKTFSFVTPNLLQKYGSYVVSDTKGLILKDTGYIMSQTHKIRVLNLVDRETSDYYNPLYYIKTEDDILKVVTNFMQNTANPDKKGGDEFFDKAETSLYMALIGYLLEEALPEERHFPQVVNLIRSIEVREDVEDYVSAVDILFEELALKNESSFAVKQYRLFKQATGKTQKSILISAGVRLAPFDIPSIASLMSHDTLELDKIGDEPTVLYIILPDTDTSYSFISSMLYQQLFDTLVHKADTVYRGTLPYNVICLQDEFANGGRIPDYDKKIATLRSRGISTNIILQNLTQLKTLYKDSWETIVGNCDSFLYLGGMESSTHKYVSKEILGKQTIYTTDTSETKGTNGSWSKQNKKMGRSLLEPDEVARLSGDKAIYVLRGVRPFLSDKYNATKHPFYQELGSVDDTKWFTYNPIENELGRLVIDESVDLSMIQFEH
ncbi:type IV secretory system conjugative DNA transfer family protein [Carnobacteriaceae bacterium zg-ZUI78]|nr:type IV secretory system conjugative DNA transfer family protein [Carnobacteriaceae bacterium zg-ZUI78]